mmetsp:Transcript_35178/g.46341  ORF Transcript_35178/g.46341 Transcript_35178/m.46341 type:complete len:139 (+) Transcript_35178:388-804(+)
MSEGEAGIEGDYGDEAGEGYRFEKAEGGKKEKLPMEEREVGGIFDKDEGDSDVEAYMDELENDEFDLDNLKLPSDDDEDAGENIDADEDDDESEEPGLDDYDDEDDFAQGMIDDYGEEADKKKRVRLAVKLLRTAKMS